MKRKHLLFTLLLALMVPLAANAQTQSTPLGPDYPSYATDFQTQTDWIPRNDVINGWCIDDAIYRSYNHSLYATATPNPNSSHPEYYVVGEEASYSYMTRLFFMEAGVYKIDYYYKGGHDYAYNNNSYPRVALVKGEHSIAAGHDMNYSIGNSAVIYLDLFVDNSNPNIPITRILPNTSTWTSHTETVTIPENSLYTLVFALEIPAGTPSGYAWTMAFDDLSIQYIEPYDLSVSDIDHLSAKLSWESLDADSWEVQYRRTSPSTSDWLHKTDLTSRNCTLDNLPTLDETTNIEVQVRANFSNGMNSQWVTTQFTAPRTPNTTYPYYTGFEYLNEDADWCISSVTFHQTQYGNDYCTETFAINEVNDPSVFSGSRCLHSWNSLYGENSLRYFQRANTGVELGEFCYAKKAFNLTRGDYSIAFNWAGQGDDALVPQNSFFLSSGDFLGVFLVPVGADLDVILEGVSQHHSTEGVISIANLHKNYFAREMFSGSFSIDTEAAGDYWLVFAWFNDILSEDPTTPRYSFAIDNLTLDRTSTYPMPTALAVSPATNSATFSWTGQESASSYTIQYKEASASTWTSVTTSTNPYTLTGLTNGTNYVAQLRINYDNNTNYSNWVNFDPFRTLLQEAVVMNATNASYYEDFESGDGGWMFLNSGTNKWRRFSYSKNGYDYGYGLRVTNSADNVLNPSWAYQTRESYTVNGQTNYLGTPATSYAIKTFTFSEGHYEFTYRFAVKGVANDDYMRVVLVPAETELVAGTMPDGFDYQSTPAGWFSLDYGGQLSGYPSNYYQWMGISTISLDVYPGGTYEPGNYMIVVLWHNPGAPGRDGQNPPGAIDNVSVTWSELLTPPTGIIVGEESDTYAILSWTAPASGLTPIGYEVQYEPLGNNNFVDAPIVATNTTSATLMGLTAHTNYQVRVRSVYTANGNSIYSDWTGAVAFTTLYPRPTNLTIADQTTSWANVAWTLVEMDLPEGQYINYWWQLTTDLNDWGDYIGQGQVSPSWTQNFTPGTYYFHVKTAVYDSNGDLMGESNWSDPLAFTIAPWTDPVTIFPFVEGFEEYSDRFADGLTLDGEYEHLGITSYAVSGVSTPEGGVNQYKLQFHSSYNKTAYLVLPPMRPSTSDALVSFWWYHVNSDNNANEGVTVEHSSDGSSWTTWGNKITRYAEETGWVKYQQVIPASGTDPVYIRLRFDGSNSNLWTRCCYLDDLTMNTFRSYQPYISYVNCDASTATITLYDYAIENDYHSSAFEVQYREWRNPGEPEEEWVTYPVIENEAPYTFINTLTVTGLQPTTLYEFRARARVSYSTFDFPWSNYCEPYRQWTSCGTHTITNNHSFTEGFEDEFYYNCWTGDIDETAWHVTTDDAHSGMKSFYIENNVTGTTNLKELITPPIDLTQLYASTDNVVLRFWVKYTSSSNHATLAPTSSVNVYNGTSTVYTLCQIPLNTNGWKQIELSLSKQMGNVVTVGFKTASRSHVMWYIDDIEIVANPYPGEKIFDVGGYDYSSQWNSSDHWYPTGAPTASDDVRVLEGSPTLPYATYNAQVKSVVIGQGASISSPSVESSLTVLEGVEVNCSRTNPSGNPNPSISIGENTTFTAGSVTLLTASPLRVSGIATIGTLNPSVENSVIVKDGGVLNATTITGTNAGANNSVIIEDGGQVKTANSFYGTIEKNITGYGAANVNDRAGWYLVATPTEVIVDRTFVPQNGSQYLFDQMDFYWFDGGQELEWINAKCSLQGGCPGPNETTIPYGQISAVLGQPKKGYLYACQEDGTVRISAGPVSNIPFPATNVDSNVSLVFYSNNDAPFNGWNLIGNPFTCNAFVKVGDSYTSYYRMNSTGDQIVLASYDDPIKPCEGVFVQCTSDPNTRTVTFSSTAPGRGNSMDFSVRKSNTRSADIIDRVRISFGEGQNLGHLDLMADPNRLYIPLKDKDLAEVHSQPVGTMPLNFEAAADGAFTLNFNNATEGLAYCHLIDNLTGSDVDLLQQPEYSFEARVSDYPSRFKVVFVAQEEGSSTVSETFAFNNNGNWVIANEGRATLQVIDVNGRILSNEEIEGCAETHINAAPGVYMIRLVNGDNVRVQKVIIK